MECMHRRKVKDVKTIQLGKTFYKLVKWKCPQCYLQFKKSVTEVKPV